jgi:hypothetical protein
MDSITLTRRGFVELGGALFVSCFAPAQAAENAPPLDPTQLSAWLKSTATTPSSPAPAEPKPAQA